LRLGALCYTAYIKELAAARQSFAFETTLASRSFVPWLREQQKTGYRLFLVFLWLSSPELAQQRVAERVILGGHGVPPEVVRRRYISGLRNFFKLYKLLMNGWVFYDNSAIVTPKRVAEQKVDSSVIVYDADIWQTLQNRYR
jgi:predicted ABC-type ATPase